jgi:hypothetical protein
LSAGTTQFVTVTCPQCGAKGSVPAGTQGELQCRKCAKIFSIDQKSPPELSDDEIGLAPALSPPSGAATVYNPAVQPPVAAETDLSPHARAIAATLKPREPDKPPDYVVVPPKNAGLTWAFTSNVFTFPWRLYALLQWFGASLGLTIAGGFALLALMGLASASREGGLAAGCFGICALFIGIFAGSYVAACFFDILTNTAYNADKLHDWPAADWRDRFWQLPRLGYLVLIASLIGVGLGGLCNLATDIFWPVLIGVVFLLLPFLVLSALEADSLFLPISGPIFRSLGRAWNGWLAFYALSGLLVAASSIVTLKAFEFSELVSPLPAGPLWAAAVFIYARLLGRLAWLILQRSAEPTKRRAKGLKEGLFRGL